MDASAGINAQDAGLFSQDAYDPSGIAEANLGGDWVEDTADEKIGGSPNNVVLDNSGNVIDQFRIFVDSKLDEVVFAFKGTNNWPDLKSDLTDDGLGEYNKLDPGAQKALINIETNPDYASYHIYTDGHSLGGGMAQNFSLQNNLDGFGQNSLPVSVSSDISGYTNRFIETNVAGDPATLLYSSIKGGQYLDPSPTTLPSAYAAGEVLGLALSWPTLGFGLAVTAYCAFQAHRIGTVNSLAANYSLGPDGHLLVPSSLCPSTNGNASDAPWLAQAVTEITNVSGNSDGSVTATEYDAGQYQVQATGSVQVGMQISVDPASQYSDWDAQSGGTATITEDDSSGSPAYAVSWSAVSADSYYHLNSGSYTVQNDGSFHWVSADNTGDNYNFTYAASSGVLSGSDSTGTTYSYNPDGSFTEDYNDPSSSASHAAGQFTLLSDGTGDMQYATTYSWGTADIEYKYYVDGSYEEITSSGDGHNDIKYASNGSWEEKGYGYGGESWDNFGTPDGSSWGQEMYGDGTSYTFASDSLGNSRYSYFDANGNKTEDDWARADGSGGYETFNGDYVDIETWDANGNSATFTNVLTPAVATDIATTAVYQDGSSSSVDHQVSPEGSGQFNLYTANTSEADGSSSTIRLYHHADGSLHDTGSFAFGDGSSLSTDNQTRTDGSSEDQTTRTFSSGLSAHTDSLENIDGSSETKTTITHSDHSTFSVDDLVNPDGSSTHSFSVVGHNSVSVQTLVSANGSSEFQILKTNTDGSSSYEDIKYQIDGTFDDSGWSTASDGSTTSFDNSGTTNTPWTQTWTDGGGNSGSDTFDLAAGKYAWSSQSSVDGERTHYTLTRRADGSIEDVLSTSYANGYSTTEDDIFYADGSFERDWHSSDGSYTQRHHDAATGTDDYHVRYYSSDGTYWGADQVGGSNGYSTAYECFRDGSHMSDTLTGATGADHFVMYTASAGLTTSLDR